MMKTNNNSQPAGAGLYDEALVNKIKNWLKDKSIEVLKPDETNRLFKMKADQRADKPITLPLIALSRKPRVPVLNTGKRPMSYDGFRVFAYNEDGSLSEINYKRMLKLNAVPIQIDYQLDIYTANFSEADEYARNFIFNFINYPNVKIEIPYNNCKLIHESTVSIDEGFEDTSDIPQRLVPGEFTRFTLNLSIDNAYLFSAPVKDNVSISRIELQVKNNDTEVLEQYDILPKEEI